MKVVNQDEWLGREIIRLGIQMTAPHRKVVLHRKLLDYGVDQTKCGYCEHTRYRICRFFRCKYKGSCKLIYLNVQVVREPQRGVMGK